MPLELSLMPIVSHNLNADVKGSQCIQQPGIMSRLLSKRKSPGPSAFRLLLLQRCLNMYKTNINSMLSAFIYSTYASLKPKQM